MPFMIGAGPIRRTLKYLMSSPLVLKERVKIFCIHYSIWEDHHKGARDFAFWHLCQLQFKNPNVQVVTLRNMTPTPFIRIFLDDGEEILVDADSRTQEEIHSHIKKIICKTNEQIAEEQKEEVQNPAHFGWGCDRHCICEVPGQVPCPAVVVLPNHMRGKYKGLKE